MTPNENEAREALEVLHSYARNSRDDGLSQSHNAEMDQHMQTICLALSLRDSEKRRADEAEAELARVREASQWRPIETAPIDVVGHVWDAQYPDRTDLMGAIREYDPGNGIKGRYVVGAGNTGMNFTLWTPLPTPPERA